MIARNPRITFEDALPHWAPNHAFAQVTNAGSTSLPYVETYLNSVMARAAQVLTDPALRADIAVFSAQEGNHYRQHRHFNRLLYGRYPGLRALENALGADYEQMLRERSLAENVAYCEGFECLGIIQTEFFFERIADLLAGADARLVKLWGWHLAEEFEHRTVCYDVHYALGGGYVGRLRGFLRALRHLGRYGKAVSAHLLSVDRAGMSAAARRESRRLERRYRARFLRFALPRLLYVLSPFYDPRRKRPPRGAAELLNEIRPAP
ncbi:MAG TPA: metal-dependent hydrolase [Steroidobacteraceae bacterium]|nr:metal-dependent hydrolase [Steroidobacteraceae bacterium]